MDLKRLAPARCLCVHKYLCTSYSIEECCINQNVAVLLRVFTFWVFGGGIITCFAVLSFSLSLYNHYLWC